MHVQDLEREWWGVNRDNLKMYCPNLQVLKLAEGFQYGN